MSDYGSFETDKVPVGIASQFRQQLHRAFSGGRSTVQAMDQRITEQTSLLPNGVSSSHLQKDESTWRDLPMHVVQVTWEVLKSNYVNFLLVFVPLGIIGGAIGWPPTVVFILNFLAIIPLASLLSFATEELSAKLGETLGGLLNATFGNAVELIVSIVALKNDEIRIVQASMLGSMLSNMLLVLGCCFIAGGLGRSAPGSEQAFNPTAAQTMAGLLGVAAASLIIPATLYAVMSDEVHIEARHNSILVLSHGTAIVLLILYGVYLYFQLKSHSHMFQASSNESDNDNDQNSGNNGDDEEAAGSSQDDQSQQEEERTILSPISAGVVLVVITVAVAVCAEYLVDSIDAIVETANISRTFIGLILIPIVGNAAEHVTAVVVSYKDKMDLAIGVAVGSSLQIALGVTPLLVILGWAMGKNMTLHFQTFETVTFFVSVLVVNYLIQDGKSNYLEGAMLLGTYVIIGLAFYIYPDGGTSNAELVSAAMSQMSAT